MSSVYQCVIFSLYHIIPKTKIPFMGSSLQCNVQVHKVPYIALHWGFLNAFGLHSRAVSVGFLALFSTALITKCIVLTDHILKTVQ